MFSFAVLALAAASANAAHSFSHMRRHHVPRAQPVGWATGYLEVYEVYHERYMAIGCENKHNTTFFDSCCHPLLATETVSKNRPACCAVGATVACPGEVASSPATHVLKPSTPAPVVIKTTTAAAPANTATDDQDEEDCEDDEDEGNPDEDNGDDEECEDDEDSSNDDDGDDDGEECEADGEEDSTAAATSTKVATTSHTAVAPTSTQHTTPATTSTHSTPATTSTHATPKTTSTTAKAATTTHTTPKPTTTTTAATPTKTSSGNFITGGFGTWFYQGGNAGACGKVHKDSDFVVALDTQMYAKGINCGRTIRLTNLSNGKTADGLVADECPSCRNGQSVDMSVKMFESLAALSVGEFSIKYQFLD